MDMIASPFANLKVEFAHLLISIEWAIVTYPLISNEAEVASFSSKMQYVHH
jgi:hypothetical protein